MRRIVILAILILFIAAGVSLAGTYEVSKLSQDRVFKQQTAPKFSETTLPRQEIGKGRVSWQNTGTINTVNTMAKAEFKGSAKEKAIRDTLNKFSSPANSRITTMKMNTENKAPAYKAEVKEIIMEMGNQSQNVSSPDLAASGGLQEIKVDTGMGNKGLVYSATPKTTTGEGTKANLGSRLTGYGSGLVQGIGDIFKKSPALKNTTGMKSFSSGGVGRVPEIKFPTK